MGYHGNINELNVDFGNENHEYKEAFRNYLVDYFFKVFFFTKVQSHNPYINQNTL